ncbi:MAG: 1-acyl-sn-glycerol-3-phosphate acyltransferase [Bacteroidales bacterium]|nr:1-acyl-sn-glycerol-3-phosphate acyltransferase [Bacteroidales bacterium]MBP8677217.1 1-acyl-sn-glycerol-3-phosphate acyltransferase [Bacteroidales bacterium]
MNDDKYVDIRPYNDQEAVLALARISKHPVLSKISAFLFPGKDQSELGKLISTIDSVYDFQGRVMLMAIKKILSDTSTTLTHTGIDKLNKEKRYLFISNHRDIMLDSAILQAILFETGLSTSEMAVGDNLITDPFLEDIARVNKMIKVVRNTNPREIYASSVLLSEFIRKRVSNEESSVWIAQRNGRTKDGFDLTEQGLLKMLDMSGNGDFTKDFSELSIVPVSVSYEYEPCDILKARELYISKRQKYIKSEGEDLNSILTGIMQYKGGIHFNFCKLISDEEIQGCSLMEKNERFKSLGEIMDRKILSTFHLWPNNFIAYDLLYSCSRFSDRYTEIQKQKFQEYVAFKIADSEGDIKELEEIFLSIYANPIISKEKLGIKL